MKNDPEVRLGLHVSGDAWYPMRYGAYAVCVHAWRFLNPDWEPHFAAMSYEVAVERGMVFG
jgi:hypothetical protein